jgi:hypothetical protein
MLRSAHRSVGVAIGLLVGCSSATSSTATDTDTGDSSDCVTLVEFDGRLASGGDGEWTLVECPCGETCDAAPEWSLAVTAPPGWEPQVPECFHFSFERVSFETESSGPVCELRGFAFWDLEDDPEHLVYALHEDFPIAASSGQLGLERIDVLASSDCGEDQCHPHQIHEITVTVDGASASLTTGGVAVLAEVGYAVYDVASHWIASCDELSTLEWIVQRPRGHEVTTWGLTADEVCDGLPGGAVTASLTRTDAAPPP